MSIYALMFVTCIHCGKHWWQPVPMTERDTYVPVCINCLKTATDQSRRP